MLAWRSTFAAGNMFSTDLECECLSCELARKEIQHADGLTCYNLPSWYFGRISSSSTIFQMGQRAGFTNCLRFSLQAVLLHPGLFLCFHYVSFVPSWATVSALTSTDTYADLVSVQYLLLVLFAFTHCKAFCGTQLRTSFVSARLTSIFLIRVFLTRVLWNFTCVLPLCAMVVFGTNLECSTSFPGGNLVDGLPPALNWSVYRPRGRL